MFCAIGYAPMREHKSRSCQVGEYAASSHSLLSCAEQPVAETIKYTRKARRNYPSAALSGHNHAHTDALRSTSIERLHNCHPFIANGLCELIARAPSGEIDERRLKDFSIAE